MPQAHAPTTVMDSTTTPPALNEAQIRQAMAAAGDWRGWLRLMLEAMATSVLIAVALGLAVLLGTSVVNAQPLAESSTPPRPSAATRNDTGQQIAGTAALWFETEQGPVLAPLQTSTVHLQVTGPIVRARVTQTYANPGDIWLHGVYQFPLPDDAGVDTLRMRIGEREVMGRIEARDTARRVFDAAKASGRQASLVAQHRPNVFSAAVANIGPGESVRIEFEYQQVLAQTRTGWTLRFPTVVAPRYSPGVSQESMITPAAHADAMPQPPTMLSPDPDQNRLQLSVAIEAGVDVTMPVSPTHAVSVNPTDAGWQLSIASDALADRDFELDWAPRADQATQASLQVEQHEGQWYGLLVVAPPELDAQSRIEAPREVTFIIDTSGSMSGALPKARSALTDALTRLSPQDRFNIIEFNDSHRSLFTDAKPAIPVHLDTARRFVRSLEANGGTQMRGALRAALQASVPEGYLSQVIFITDGAVDNEDALFNQIDSLLGQRRLFTVGIGSAPNEHFMRRAAAAGRGTFTTIGTREDIADRMQTLFDSLSYPMLADLAIRDDQGNPVDTGGPIRDLYAGQAITRTFRLPARPAGLHIEGRRGRSGWQENLSIREVDQRGINRLWAREAIDELRARIRRTSFEGHDADDLRRQATDIALDHHLVSEFTSLVAVDQTPARRVDDPAIDTQVPRHLPAGWDARATFGSAVDTLAQTDNGLWHTLLTGVLLLMSAGAIMLVAWRSDRTNRTSDLGMTGTHQAARVS